MPESPIIFIHGLDSSSQGFKGRLLRGIFPTIVAPDFTGSLEQRLEQLAAVLGNQQGWAAIGSSFGGLMATLHAAANPQRFRRLVLLAPALVAPFDDGWQPTSITVPTIIYHGARDEVAPLAPVRAWAQHVFTNLDFRAVDDDHMLHSTVTGIDWLALLEEQG